MSHGKRHSSAADAEKIHHRIRWMGNTASACYALNHGKQMREKHSIRRWSIFASFMERSAKRYRYFYYIMKETLQTEKGDSRSQQSVVVRSQDFRLVLSRGKHKKLSKIKIFFRENLCKDQAESQQSFVDQRFQPIKIFLKIFKKSVDILANV